MRISSKQVTELTSKKANLGHLLSRQVSHPCSSLMGTKHGHMSAAWREHWLWLSSTGLSEPWQHRAALSTSAAATTAFPSVAAPADAGSCLQGKVRIMQGEAGGTGVFSLGAHCQSSKLEASLICFTVAEPSRQQGNLQSFVSSFIKPFDSSWMQWEAWPLITTLLNLFLLNSKAKHKVNL